MRELTGFIESFGLPPLIQLILLPFALIGGIASAIKGWDILKEFVRHRLTHWAEYDLLKKIRTGLERGYIESLLGQPARLMQTSGGKHDVAMYEKPEYLLKLVYTETGTVGMYSVTVRNPSFRPSFLVAGSEYRLGDVTYADFPDEWILYATFSSKDLRYAESHSLANPGDYQDLLLATHFPPGILWNQDDGASGIASLCHKLTVAHGEPVPLPTDDEVVMSVREHAKPNCYGFAAPGFDHAGSIAVGAVYADIRPLLREG